MASVRLWLLNGEMLPEFTLYPTGVRRPVCTAAHPWAASHLPPPSGRAKRSSQMSRSAPRAGALAWRTARPFGEPAGPLSAAGIRRPICIVTTSVAGAWTGVPEAD